MQEPEPARALAERKSMRKLEQQTQWYLDYCEKVRNLTPMTMEHMRYSMKRFLSGVPAKRLEDLTNAMLDGWVAEMQANGAHGRTINGYLRFILAMTRFYRRRGVKIRGLNEDAVELVKEMPAERKFYTEEQINQVLALSDDFQWLLISLAFRCGFRISELAHLRLDNFNGRRCNFIGKGRKNREVWITKEIEERLSDWIEENGVTDWLWKSRQKPDTPLSNNWIRKRMRLAFESAGITGFHPHSLRHSFATNICRNGAPLPVAQRMLGHSRIATTELYVHSFDGRLEEFFDKYAVA